MVLFSALMQPGSKFYYTAPNPDLILSPLVGVKDDGGHVPTRRCEKFRRLEGKRKLVPPWRHLF